MWLARSAVAAARSAGVPMTPMRPVMTSSAACMPVGNARGPPQTKASRSGLVYGRPDLGRRGIR